MFYIRNAGNAKAAMSKEAHFTFVKQCETYIQQLKAKEQLIAAQPIMPEGKILSKDETGWLLNTVGDSTDVQVGYYHIIAADMEEAIAIAKLNPEFSFVPSASIEIRQVKTKETSTNFVYPK
ncbi:MAG: hypothetical protein RLZZ28_344 [Bacteroidota bacterium]